MLYGVFFAAVSLLCAVYAFNPGGVSMLLLWPSASFMTVAVAYFTRNGFIFGKRRDGRLGAFRVIVLLPFLLTIWLMWHILRALRPEPPCHEVAPGLFLGRLPLPGEVPEEVRVIVDMTAEHYEHAEVMKGREYILIPTLDGSAPGTDHFVAAMRHVLPAGGAMLVHCAEGYGRSAMCAAVIMVLKGAAKNIEEAEEIMRRSRSRVAIRSSQSECARKAIRALAEGL
ncbi:MAG: hypothetical protein RDV48_23670 [Candidatus Eremiobacteraeota bacterium]|nr:hypothetical protein [Candidatus Eremiobacteraeota bacterium]